MCANPTHTETDGRNSERNTCECGLRALRGADRCAYCLEADGDLGSVAANEAALFGRSA